MNQIPVMLFGTYMNRKAEDSLENTFTCVPKVQGESRISQANGRRCFLRAHRFPRQSCMQGCFFILSITEMR